MPLTPFDAEQHSDFNTAIQELGRAVRHHFVSKNDLREMEERLTNAINEAASREDAREVGNVLRHSERITRNLERLAGTEVPK